jgi:ankyrin repeat protein
MLASRKVELDIFEASALGNLEQIRRAVQQDIKSVNAVAGDGFQPLGLASFFGHAEAVAYLLGMGAEVNSPSRNLLRVMPLHSAVARQSLAIARMLLAAGAEVNATQADEFTPLHEAAQNGQLEMVQLLIVYGADPAQTNKDGLTALQIAEKYQHPEVVTYLQFSE